MKTRSVVVASASLAVVALLWRANVPRSESLPTTESDSTVVASAGPSFAVAPTPVRASVAPEPVNVASPVAPLREAYLPGQRLVRLDDPMELPEVAADYDLEVLRPAGRSGYALVTGPDDALRAASQDPRVQASTANARTVGASQPRALQSFQWFVDKVDPAPMSSESIDVVVAVLDTGVAYETAVRDGVAYSVAPSLASSLIVAPYDFINDDPHANDDHQHGTHIASIIASDSDEIRGVAPGAALMPVKVLDEHNQGDELSLVEGIWHSIDNRADIVNMSLSFHLDYTPSIALQEALQAAADAGIVLVAASGNDGADRVTWPAASPEVVAVGAANLRAYGSWESEGVASYSNASAAVDLVAPGGNLHDDINGDGVADGILAETIQPGEPSDVGYWLMSGTSQAAAMVSGAAVPLVAAGFDRAEVEDLLKEKSDGRNVWMGRGSGYLDLDWELPTVEPDPRTYYVAMLPYISVDPHGWAARPKARVTVFDGEGNRAGNIKVYADIWGNGDEPRVCSTDDQGVCTLWGHHIGRDANTGEMEQAAWVIAVQSVLPIVGGNEYQKNYRVKAAITATDSFQEIVGALQANPATTSAMLAWGWADADHAELGHVGPGYSVVDTGAGLTSIPLGIVMTPKAMRSLNGQPSETMVGVNGEEMPVTVVSLDGSGLTSIPLGMTGNLNLAFLNANASMDGTGLKSLPLGFKVGDAYGDGKLVKLDEPVAMSGTHLGAKLAEGGWRIEGYGAASFLGSSDSLGIEPSFAPHNDNPEGCEVGDPLPFLP